MILKHLADDCASRDVLTSHRAMMRAWMEESDDREGV